MPDNRGAPKNYPINTGPIGPPRVAYQINVYREVGPSGSGVTQMMSRRLTASEVLVWVRETWPEGGTWIEQDPEKGPCMVFALHTMPTFLPARGK